MYTLNVKIKTDLQQLIYWHVEPSDLYVIFIDENFIKNVEFVCTWYKQKELNSNLKTNINGVGSIKEKHVLTSFSRV